MNPPRRLRGTFGMCNLREGFVNLREGFVVAPWRLREAFSKTRSAKASRSPLEGFAKASRRRHGRLHLETIRQIMTSPHYFGAYQSFSYLGWEGVRGGNSGMYVCTSVIIFFRP